MHFSYLFCFHKEAKHWPIFDTFYFLLLSCKNVILASKVTHCNQQQNGSNKIPATKEEYFTLEIQIWHQKYTYGSRKWEPLWGPEKKENILDRNMLSELLSTVQISFLAKISTFFAVLFNSFLFLDSFFRATF